MHVQDGRQNDLFFSLWYGVYDYGLEAVDVTYRRSYTGDTLPARRIKGESEARGSSSGGPAIGFMGRRGISGVRTGDPESSKLYLFSDGAYETGPL
jgi:hypothetical protein